MNLKFKKLHLNAQLPVYATDEAAGMDVFSCLENSIVLQAGEAAAIPTGIAMELPQGYEAQFRGRSGLAFKHAVFSFNGTIDSDYVGELKGLLINHSRSPFTIEPGMRIGQLVVNAAVVRCRPEFVDELKITKRGDGGFGSTGLCAVTDECAIICDGVVSDEFVDKWKKDVGYIPYHERMGDEPVDQDAVKDSLLNIALGKK